MKKLNTYFIESRIPQVQVITVSVRAESVEEAMLFFHEYGDGTPVKEVYEAAGLPTRRVYRQELIHEYEETSKYGDNTLKSDG